MEKRPGLFALKHLFVCASPEERKAVQEARPFFFVVVLLLVGLYGYALYTVPELRLPGRLLFFSLLMAVHAFLHWNTPLMVHRPRAGLPYIMVQGALAFMIAAIVGDIIASLILFAVLIGEAVGVLRGMWAVVIGVAYLVAVAAISVAWTSGGQTLSFLWLTVLPIAAFVVLYVALYGRQAEARQQAQALLQELETAHKQLAEYAIQVEDLTRTAERERMARELHDTLAQGLAGLILQLEAADAHLSDERPGRAQEIVQQAMARARTTLADSRRVIDDLRADQGEPEELAVALRGEVSRFSKATGIRCSLELDLPYRIPAQVSEHIQRIIAEGLTNITRHAEASQAEVSITGDSDTLLIQISDNGRGFDPSAGAMDSGHYGLIGLRERARLVNGSLDIISAPGRGATLRLQIPYQPVDGEFKP
jgi:NarL family two-component system sensor histidine kinase YdfH